MAEPVGALGTRGVVRTERGMDVTLRYAFPAEGLKPEPLSTLLMLVVSTASQPRNELPAGTGDGVRRLSSRCRR